MQDIVIPLVTPENIDSFTDLLIQDSGEAYSEIPKHAGGRPSVMTKTVLRKLKQGFLMGFSDREASAYAGIGEQTLYDYQKVNPRFSEQKEVWKENPILKAKTTVYNKLGDISTAKWYLERKAKEEFSLKQETQTNEDLGKIEELLDDLDWKSENVDDVAENLQKLQEAHKNSPVS